MTTLTMVLNFCGHNTSKWTQLYDNDPKFASTYQALCAGILVENFYLQEGLLCHLGTLCVPLRESGMHIWEAHYSRLLMDKLKRCR